MIETDNERSAMQLWRVSSESLKATASGVGEVATRKQGIGSDKSTCNHQERVSTVPNNVTFGNGPEREGNDPLKRTGKGKGKRKSKGKVKTNHQQINF